jgi:biopolymer transport protein ExbB
MRFLNNLIKRRLLALYLCPIASILSAKEIDDLPTVDTSLSLWGLIQQGGWAMYPLGICSLITFFLIAYAWRETRTQCFINRELNQEIEAFIIQGELANCQSRLKRSNNVLGRALSAGLQQLEKDSQKAENCLLDRLDVEENSIGQWIHYLNVVASVAPMIGLLGTVSGMISAFQTIGRGGMGRPELLAGDIGEALVTTATGLTIGIPAMIAYFILRNRLNSLMLLTSQIGSELLAIPLAKKRSPSQ